MALIYYEHCRKIIIAFVLSFLSLPLYSAEKEFVLGHKDYGKEYPDFLTALRENGITECDFIDIDGKKEPEKIIRLLETWVKYFPQQSNLYIRYPKGWFQQLTVTQQERLRKMNVHYHSEASKVDLLMLSIDEYIDSSNNDPEGKPLDNRRYDFGIKEKYDIEDLPEEKEDEPCNEPIIKGYVFTYNGKDNSGYKNTECVIYDADIIDGVLTEVLRESPEQILEHLKDFKNPKIYLCTAVYNNLSDELKTRLKSLGYTQPSRGLYIPKFEDEAIRLLMGYTNLSEDDKYELRQGFNRMYVLLKDIRKQFPDVPIRIPRILYEAFPTEYQKAFREAGYEGVLLELI